MPFFVLGSCPGYHITFHCHVFLGSSCYDAIPSSDQHTAYLPSSSVPAHAVISVVSNSLQPHGLEPTGLLCYWDFPGKNTGLVAISPSRGSSWPRDWTHISCIAGRFFTHWATWESLQRAHCLQFLSSHSLPKRLRVHPYSFFQNHPLFIPPKPQL